MRRKSSFPGRWIAIAGALALVAAAVVGFMVFSGDPGKAGPGKEKKEALPVAEQSPWAPDAPETKPSESPDIKPYARKLTGKTVPPNPDRTKNPVVVPQYSDGCDHGYGTIDDCVPWNFPPSIKTYQEKCAYLEDNNLSKVAVHPPDRHGLDPDKNGIACDQ